MTEVPAPYRFCMLANAISEPKKTFCHSTLRNGAAARIPNWKLEIFYQVEFFDNGAKNIFNIGQKGV